MRLNGNIKDAVITAESQKSLLLMKNKLTDYDVGMYNGIEYILSRIKGREPEYIAEVKEPEVIQKQETKTRTIASGIRKKGG